MGAVYLGRDLELNRQVAIKVIREEVHDQEVLDRFFHEARAAAALRHPNIITVYASGQHQHQPYMVMEFIDGESLAEMIRSRRDVSILHKLSYLEQICSGLHFAHRAGIIHRDIKPANVMVDKEGMVRILDFGIARIEGSVMTLGGALIGSVNYMSPEQMLGRSIDYRSDIFSVGSLAYELLSYQQAFKGGLTDGLLQRLPYEHPPSLSQTCPGLPAGLEGVVVRALQKAPEDRFQDLAEMRTAILDIQQRLDPAGEQNGNQNTVMILREALQASLGTSEDSPPTSLPFQWVPAPAPGAAQSETAAGVAQPGGHDEVYRAADASLDRAVADQFVPQAVTRDTPLSAAPTWEVRTQPWDAGAKPGMAAAKPATSGTSRPLSTGTSRPLNTRTTRSATTTSRSQAPAASSRRWVLVGSGAAALVVSAAATFPWLTAAPADPIDQERPGIAVALERFRIGYRTRDLEAVRAAFPTLRRDVQQMMQRTFSACLVYEVTFDQVAIELASTDAAVAQADVRSTHTCTLQSGGRQTTATRHDVYTLRKDGDIWIIDAVASPPPSPADRPR